MKKWFFIAASTLLFLTSCSEKTVQTDSKKVMTEDEYVHYIEKVDFEKEAKKAYKRAKALSLRQEDLEKWYVREHIQSLLLNQNISEKELIKKARHSLRTRNAWFQFAKEKQGIDVTEKEVDDYIDAYVGLSGYAKEIAKGLGLSEKEYLYAFERDTHKRDYIWIQLTPTIESLYAIRKNEEYATYNERVFKLFEKDALEYVEKRNQIKGE